MEQIRDTIWRISLEDFERPLDRGYVMVKGLGEVLFDQADLRYIEEIEAKGYEPVFHVRQSAALGNAFVVVARQQKA